MSQFKLRITRRVTGEVDGVDMRRFQCGFTYLVGTTLASYLLAIKAAVPAAENAPAIRLPPPNHLFGPPRVRDRRTVPRPRTRERRRRFD